VDFFLVTLPSEADVVGVDDKVFCHFVGVDLAPHAQADFVFAAEGMLDAVRLTVGEFFEFGFGGNEEGFALVGAANGEDGVAAGDEALASKTGLVISAKFRWSKSFIWRLLLSTSVEFREERTALIQSKPSTGRSSSSMRAWVSMPPSPTITTRLRPKRWRIFRSACRRWRGRRCCRRRLRRRGSSRASRRVGRRRTGVCLFCRCGCSRVEANRQVVPAPSSWR